VRYHLLFYRGAFRALGNYLLGEERRAINISRFCVVRTLTTVPSTGRRLTSRSIGAPQEAFGLAGDRRASAGGRGAAPLAGDIRHLSTSTIRRADISTCTLVLLNHIACSGESLTRLGYLIGGRGDASFWHSPCSYLPLPRATCACRLKKLGYQPAFIALWKPSFASA